MSRNEHHSTFEPCKKHENGHFNWCLLCEIDHPREKVKEQEATIQAQAERIQELERELARVKADLDYHNETMAKRRSFFREVNGV